MEPRFCCGIGRLWHLFFHSPDDKTQDAMFGHIKDSKDIRHIFPYASGFPGRRSVTNAASLHLNLNFPKRFQLFMFIYS